MAFKKGNIAWNKGLKGFKHSGSFKSGKEHHMKQPKNKQKTSEDMKQQYLDGRRDRFKTTEAAHEAAKRRTRAREARGYFNRRIDKRGYWLIYLSGRGWMKEHHYLWKKAGRNIPQGYVLHHKNGDRLDNRLENFELMTKSEHSKHHYNLREINPENGRLV